MQFRHADTAKMHTRMRHERFVESGTDAHGHATGDWELISRVTVEKHLLGARRGEWARQLYDLATHEVLMWYQRDVQKGDRLVDGSDVLAIGFVYDVESVHRTLFLLCSEGDP